MKKRQRTCHRQPVEQMEGMHVNLGIKRVIFVQLFWRVVQPHYDIVGEFGGVDPAPPRGCDKSGPYALAIASLGSYGQFANNILMWLYRPPILYSRLN